MVRSLALTIVLVTANVFHADETAASTWDIDPEQSALTYEVAIGGAGAQGTFGAWSAEIAFDPAAPEAGRVDVEIAIGSVTISDSRAASSVGAPAWLNTATFPTAVFTAAGFNMASEGAFTLPGTLTLRGVTHPVALSGTILIENNTATVAATTAFDRALFQIGDGQDAVAQEVRVRVDLVATRTN